MKFRFSIARKLGLGFGMLTVLIITVIAITVYSVSNGVKILEKSTTVNDQITNIYDPSEKQLKNLHNLVVESKLLIIMWAWVESKPEEDFKLRLHKIINKEMPELKDTLYELSQKWENQKEILKLQQIDSNINDLFEQYKFIIDLHPNLESYKDKQSYFLGISYVGEGFEIDLLANEIVNKISDLEEVFSERTNEARINMNAAFKSTNDSFDFLLHLVIYLGSTLILGAILIGLFTTRSIVRPVNKLRNMLVSLGRGVLPKSKMNVSNDEIGDMSQAMNQLVSGLKETTYFANELGQSNFDYEYKPLSNEDTLGHALLKMRQSLAENERILEQKVKERTEEVVRQRDQIEQQRSRVEELYKDVTDSIRYAKRLQESILPPEQKMEALFKDYFVFYRPKDIVSGDFYWVEQTEEKVLFSAVDCTGHGVPGAFMSLVGANGLNQAVLEHQQKSPAEIMNDLNKFAVNALNKNEDSNVRDGMDMAICLLDSKNMMLEFAGANNPLYLVRDGKLIQYKPDKFSIGSYADNTNSFKNNQVAIQENDALYIFSDGYADQFGGPRGKKFMYKQFRELLEKIAHLPMKEQNEILGKTLDDWMGDSEQIDDILIIGVRV